MNKLRIEGKVIKTFPDKVEVEISPPRECSGCGSCDYSKKKIISIPAPSPIPPGSKVAVKINCRSLTGMSFLAYFIPAVFLLGGFTGGYVLWGKAGGFFGAVLLLVTGSVVTSRLSRNCYRDAVRVEKND